MIQFPLLFKWVSNSGLPKNDPKQKNQHYLPVFQEVGHKYSQNDIYTSRKLPEIEGSFAFLVVFIVSFVIIFVVCSKDVVTKSVPKTSDDSCLNILNY